jgi:hypothetical protein
MKRYISEDAINDIILSRMSSYSESDPQSKAKADELKALQKELAKTDDDVILRRGKE